ncbi:carboxylesterase [Xylogone sp. PMI_703]|nr:carboxylesterase [Xylogone sp. PMI_703]
MANILVHPTLKAELHGTESSSNGIGVTHYRGIPYGKIPQRFRKSELVDDWKNEKLDCTKFGPQCPQNYVEVEHMLRIPDLPGESPNPQRFEADEFKCLNLNVSVPAGEGRGNGLLPVLIWIYGGSQVVSYLPLAHKGSDTTSLVAHSVALNKPMIVVTFNYRLNIFGFGDQTEKNLALKDQRIAVEWVVKHIEAFGGDKDNITLGGESAGAIYAHAHISTGSPVKRAILQSGSLSLSLPLPPARGDGMIAMLRKAIQEKHQVSLDDASPDQILAELAESNINTLWIQEEPDLVGWTERDGAVEELLVGDCEYESVIWRNGVEAAGPSVITEAFGNNLPKDQADLLKHLYNISPTRSTPTVLGALDFISDVRYARPVEQMVNNRRSQGRKTYRYLIDEPNPWQSSARSHHAVDLIFLFGNYDLSFNKAAMKVSKGIRDSWVAFINGEAPWDEKERMGFGPYGRVGIIDEDEFEARRRVRHWKALDGMKWADLLAASGQIAAGRISLHN